MLELAGNKGTLFTGRISNGWKLKRPDQQRSGLGVSWLVSLVNNVPMIAWVLHPVDVNFPSPLTLTAQALWPHQVKGLLPEVRL
jgi:hypothetical protein